MLKRHLGNFIVGVLGGGGGGGVLRRSPSLGLLRICKTVNGPGRQWPLQARHSLGALCDVCPGPCITCTG